MAKDEDNEKMQIDRAFNVATATPDLWRINLRRMLVCGYTYEYEDKEKIQEVFSILNLTED